MTGFSLLENFNIDPERLLRKTRACKIPSAPVPQEEEETVSEAPIQMVVPENSLREYTVPTTDNVVVDGP